MDLLALLDFALGFVDYSSLFDFKVADVFRRGIRHTFKILAHDGQDSIWQISSKTLLFGQFVH